MWENFTGMLVGDDVLCIKLGETGTDELLEAIRPEKLLDKQGKLEIVLDGADIKHYTNGMGSDFSKLIPPNAKSRSIQEFCLL